MHINTIIFDFFGVIAVEVRSALIRAYAHTELVTQEIHQAFDAADTGYTSCADLYERCARATGKRASDIERFIYDAAVIDREMITLIRSLHTKHKIALCSNAPLGLVESLISQYHFADCFDEICISSTLHILKPNPKIFHVVLERLGSKASDALFIDDNPHNTAAAEGLGIMSIVHVSREETQARLKHVVL